MGNAAIIIQSARFCQETFLIPDKYFIENTNIKTHPTVKILHAVIPKLSNNRITASEISLDDQF